MTVDEFERRANKMRGRLESFATRFLRNPEDAKDAVGETLAKAFIQRDRFRDEHENSFEAWVLQIHRNKLLQELRERKRRVSTMPLEEEIAADGRDPKVELIARVAEVESPFSPEVAAALRSLSEDQRAVLILVDIQERTREDAAGILGIGVGTLYTRLFRARTAMRNNLGGTAPRLEVGSTV